MQKTNNRTPMNTTKVAKKAKKMGTPSPPKKKKSNELKTGESVVNAATKTPKTKTPVKKIAVVAKKSNVGKKELKVAVKKKSPIKIPAQIKKIIKKPVAKKVKPPKVTPEKSEKVEKADKADKPEKPEKSEKKVTTPKQSQIEKSTEKNEENEVVIPKAKKLKKCEEECTKTTAKKQNSKLSKKSNDTEPAVKTLPSTIVHNEVVKDVAKNSLNKKSNEKLDKKSGLNTEKTEENIDEVKSKVAPKKKLVKVVKKIPVEKKIVKKVQKPVKTEVVEEIDKNKKDDIVAKGEPEKKPVKKETTVEVEKDKELRDKKQKVKEDEESDKDTKETIAKLLKEVNKTILKSPTKKKRETINSKTSPNNSIIKKSKIICKPKPKKQQEVLIKVKTESTDAKDEIIESPQKKVAKKVVTKPKKKVVIKTEEQPEPKKEKNTKAENEIEDKSKVADEEKNTNTDDSTTSDEITLNLLRQSQSSSPSQTQSQSEKKSDEAVKAKAKKKIKIKSENSSDTDRKSKVMKQMKKTVVKKIQQKKKMLLLKNKMRKITKERKRSTSTDTEQQKNRKLKLYSWWAGPKRHRVASLNALAKVHCLYENESRGALYDVIKRSPVTKESNSEGEPDNDMDGDTEPSVEPSTRTLRSVPGLRGVGKHWEMHDETSSSSCEEASNDSSVEAPKRKLLTPPPSYKQKEEKRKEAEKKPSDEKEKKPVRKRRNRTELIMDLKDMVVRKRMASLNASAILAASYSVEKKPFRSPKSESSTETSDTDESIVSDTIEKEYKRKCYDSDVSVKKEESSDRKVIEVRASPNKKVAVILNQDTDVTITGVYVNSTTRSTHHEGYCSIAGMQYRISATSHTQTAATAVATETLLHSTGEHGPPEQPCKSYTPLGALSNMQPPGSHPHGHPHGHGHPAHVVPPAAVSPSGRRHGCTSAFAAPPPTQYGPPHSHPHHHHHGPHPPPPPPPLAADQQPPPAYIHGYYQPAGPLITAHHGHSHPPPAPAGKTAPLPTLEASPSPTPPPTTHQPPPSSTGTAESSDNEVIITSASSGSAEQVPVALPAAQTYRYATSSQFPPGTHAPPGYSYSYPPSQYYHSAPAGFAQQQHYHHDICYPGSAYPPSYLHPKAYTTTFRRYLPPPSGPQYYPANPELYSAPPSSGQSSQVVTASSGAGGSTYQTPPTGPAPPTLVESYAPPVPVPPTIVEPYPPPHYYTPSYGSGPAPPPCYSHSPPTRNLAFIEPAYQSCPCPMQSCPKNVHTGPLTGDGKRSNAIAKESMPLPLPLPLPPVALALPLEPASVAGPPSPARGSAGMPPPPSPAGATYQPTPTPSKWDTTETELLHVDTKTTTPSTLNTTRNKPRLGKTMVRNTILNNNNNNNNNTNNNNNNNNNNINITNNNITHHPQGMLLMCHQSSNTQTPPQQADVKREVESPEEQKPTPDTTVEIQSNQTDPQSKTKAKTKTETETEIEHELELDFETEVQNNITNECSKRLNSDDVNQKLLKSEECDEPTLQNGPVRRKSNVHVDVELPQQQKQQQQQQQQAPVQNETNTVINHLEKTSTKRKLTIEEEPVAPQTKKQKPNLKPKPKSKPNGSYKNLIKRNNNNNKCIKINNGKRKLILESELKSVTEGKTPKIVLGKNRKTTKRKSPNTTKDEPVVKKAKTSKPLIERNVHMLKQNVRLKDKHQESIENKEPVVNSKKTIQRKNQVNSKSSTLNINNVDRTIESVILNCAHVDETLRTSDSVLKQVVDKQNNNKQNCNNKQANLTDVIKTTDITITATTTAATTTATTTTTKQNPNLTKVTHATKAAKIGCGRAGTTKRKSKDKPLLPVPLPVSRIPRRSFNLPKWSNGWSWEGDCFQGKVFINSDEPLVVRKCYPAMRHQEGDIISPRDCVLLKAGPRKIDLPFVAKVAALWEDEEGEMMMSLLWYYRPEHTEQGRRPIDQPDEVFASRHKDTNSVACIEDKCYVLTFNEYCRYRKNVRRIEEGMEQTEQIVPLPEGGQYYREHRQPPALLATAPDLVFFCRQVYDFRQKRIVKNPS